MDPSFCRIGGDNARGSIHPNHGVGDGGFLSACLPVSSSLGTCLLIPGGTDSIRLTVEDFRLKELRIFE